MSALFVANWKMNMLRAEAAEFVRCFLQQYKPSDKVLGSEVWIAPSYTAISEVASALKNNPEILVGAQNAHWESKGAHTGEISVEMLKDIGAKFAILGHSERRQFYGEDSRKVALRANACAGKGLYAIVCVGETKDEFSAGQSNVVVQKQLAESLDSFSKQLANFLVVAYEPVWAIGTGLAATSKQAGQMHTMIRQQLIEQFGVSGREIRILYGGSTKPENIAELLEQEDIDGALVGGASLSPDTFWSMISSASGVTRIHT